MQRKPAFAASLLGMLMVGCAVGGADAQAPPAEAAPGASVDRAASTRDRSTSNAEEAMGVTGDLQSMIRAALADATRRAPSGAPAPRLISAEHVTWPDGSLGCPLPGRVYTMALVRGYRIRVQSGDTELAYHAGERGMPFLCPPDRATGAAPDTRVY